MNSARGKREVTAVCAIVCLILFASTLWRPLEDLIGYALIGVIGLAVVGLVVRFTVSWVSEWLISREPSDAVEHVRMLAAARRDAAQVDRDEQR